MSLDATRWAWKQQVKPTAKLVLLSMADRAGEAHEAWPTISRLESDTGLDRKTIMAVTKSLEEQGLISVTRYSGLGNVYQLVGVDDRQDMSSKPVPKTGQVKNGTSPKNGMTTSPKNGTQNLPIEPTRESTKTHTDVLPDTEVNLLSAAQVCVLWVSLGVVHCNPAHPDLLALVGEGVLADEWEFAGKTARDGGKGFGYALGIVRSRLAERQRGGGVGNASSGGQRGKHGKFGGGSRIEHSRRIGEHLDRLIKAEFGSGVGVGAV